MSKGKFDTKSIYALNKKDPDAIVYRDAEGAILRLTRGDFTSEAEFLQWKAWSDEDYHASEKEVHVFSNHTLSLFGLSDEAVAVPSPEASLEDAHDERERERLYRLLRDGMNACLTPTQRRRLWMYCVDRLTEDEIALAESVRQQSVSECLRRAKEKMKKYLKRAL